MRQICVVWLSMMLTFGSTFLLIDLSEDTEGKVVVQDGVNYVPHAPIRINGDGDFAAIATSGDGSPGTPWIIEGWEINGTGYGCCIFIGNTTEHFVIQNCYLYGATAYSGEYYENAGCNLYYCVNGAVKNITSQFNWNGIWIDHSEYIIIENNTMRLNDIRGVLAYYNQNCTIVNNTCHSNLIQGIELYASDVCTVSNNTIINSTYYGMTITASTLCKISNNTFVNSSIMMHGVLLESWNTHEIDSLNNVNGKPIYYVKNATGGSVPPGAGSVILANCTGFTVENQYLNDTTVGILMGHGNGNYIRNNTILRNNMGSDISWTTGNYFINNTVDNCSDGIRTDRSDGNVFDNNTISSCYYGMYIGYSDGNTIVNSSVSNCSYRAIRVYYSSGNSIIKTTVPNNDQHGIHFLNSHNGNRIIDSTVFSNIEHGIYLENADNNIIENSTVFSNGDYGIYVRGDDNTILNSTLYSNYEGIRVYIATGNSIINCTAFSNLYGLNVRGFSHNTKIRNVNASSNIVTGVVVSQCDDVVIENVTANDCQNGIAVRGNNNKIMNSTTSSSFWYGISLRGLCNNVVNNSLINDSIYMSSSSLVDWNTHTIDTSNTVNGNPVYYLKNITNNVAPTGGGEYILANCTNVTVSNQLINGGSPGVQIGFGSNNTVKNNTILSNRYSIHVTNSENNKIYHNHLDLAYNRENNYWDNGYPSGGNYWSSHTSSDIRSGPNQDQPGSDGICDSEYTDILGGSGARDNYPLKSPFNYTEISLNLPIGWNLISLPVRQLNWSIDSVLESIVGKWDCIQTYNSSDSSWKSNNIYRPDSLNDLEEMNHLKAYWINITEPGVTLTVKGDKFNSTLSIPLKTGWNFVGYPSLVEKSISDALAGTGYDKPVEGFDGGAPYHISQLLDTYMMKPGEGYWVHVPADTVWVVDW